MSTDENSLFCSVKEPKILIVDDMLVNIMILEEMLKKFGYTRIKSTTNSTEVIKIYLEYQPDLVLLDLNMPRMDGFQIMERLNEIKEDDYLPIIVITAQNDKENKIRAAEFRDNDTGEHIIRIGFNAYELGKLAGLDEDICKILTNASVMHDIGKIGIPDNILLKPGKLSPDEWVIMKTHTTKGAEILTNSKSELIKMAEVIALTHHEKWDGTGYPRGLKGEEIPLVGRITAICDVFDAILVEKFLDNIGIFIKIKEKYS